MCVFTFSQCLPDLFSVSGQVEVGLPGLQVANRAASPSHTKPLNEQICGQDVLKKENKVITLCVYKIKYP